MINPCKCRLGLVTTLLILVSSATLSVPGQSHCDSSLTALTASELGYRDRGDRCEGLYIQKVHGATLQIASLTEYFENYDPRSGKPLQVAWSRPPGNSPVRLRTQGINPRLYYRMDSTQPFGNTSYVWPTNVLASLNIGEKDIGVLALTRYLVGQIERDIYVPVRISQAGKAIRTGSYKLILLPGVELQEIFVTLAPVSPHGQPSNFIKDREKLGYGLYPAERRIEIPISGLKTPGTYYLHVGATLKAGGSSTLELWFYTDK